MYCIKCGAQNVDTAAFCIQCGEPFTKMAGNKEKEMTTMKKATNYMKTLEQQWFEERESSREGAIEIFTDAEMAWHEIAPLAQNASDLQAQKATYKPKAVGKAFLPFMIIGGIIVLFSLRMSKGGTEMMEFTVFGLILFSVGLILLIKKKSRQIKAAKAYPEHIAQIDQEIAELYEEAKEMAKAHPSLGFFMKDQFNIGSITFALQLLRSYQKRSFQEVMDEVRTQQRHEETLAGMAAIIDAIDNIGIYVENNYYGYY